MSREKQLLEDLKTIVGCGYISDLRFLNNREIIIMAIAQLRPEDYSPTQWKEALCYFAANGHEHISFQNNVVCSHEYYLAKFLVLK